MAGRVLLIGAAGLVGQHVRAALKERDVVATFHDDPIQDGVALDVTDASAVHSLVTNARPSAIVLAAADPSVERCERDPAGTRRLNVDATETVRDAAAASGATLVVFSSEYVFDGTGGSYGEDDPTHPLNEYGRQKADIERLARALPRHLVLRLSGVFGAERRRKNFVWQLVDQLRTSRTFEVPSDQLITPTDALSLGVVVRELLDRDSFGTFHAAGPQTLSRVEFAHLVAQAFVLPTDRIRPRPTADLGLLAARPARAGLRDSKLRALLGHGLTHPRDALAQLAREN